MICPKCQHEMETIEYAGIEVDRCRNCHGIWFDVGEDFSLRDEEAAAAIDTGDPDIGRETNTINRYRCPRCDGGMLRMTDSRRKDIWYEECTACRGSFFDAGEFADLSRERVAEILVRSANPDKN